MKGITHFVSGICAASFIPGVVAGAVENPWLLALGGVAAFLPDLVDFRLLRFLERYDETIELGSSPQELDPQAMADHIAAQIKAAAVTNTPRSVRLHTFQLGADRWQRYSVEFGCETGRVQVRLGSVVSTGQQVLAERENAESGEAAAGLPLELTCDPLTTVDILSGPSFRFEPTPAGVRVEFLPWHRRWSHSLLLAAAAGCLVGAVLGWQSGAVVAAGWGIHVVEDQLGYMGSNLFWPLTRRRQAGLRWFHSGDAPSNVLTIWLALWLLLWNLARQAAWRPADVWLLLGVGLGLPAGAAIVHRLRSGGRPRGVTPAVEHDDLDAG